MCALEAGEALETGVLRFSALARTRDAVTQETAGADPSVIVIGGDCGVSVGAIGAALEREPSLAVVWFDAHPDLHTPETSISGAFGGMALSAVLGEGADGLALPSGGDPAGADRAGGGARLRDRRRDPRRPSSASVRSMSPICEPETLADRRRGDGGVRRVHPRRSGRAGSLGPHRRHRRRAVRPHADQLLGAISAVRGAVPLAGATIAGFAPVSPDAAADDLGTILRIVGALA